MPPAIGKNRPLDLAYAMRWLDLQDAEDVVHDAYEVALRRGERPTSLRLAIKQCMGQFMAARARGWTVIGDGAERVAAVGVDFELRQALESCNEADLETLLDLQGGGRALSRANARKWRRARRRVCNCLIAIC